MIDTHAHVHAPAFDRDRPDVLRRAFDAGLHYLLEVNIDAGGWSRCHEVAAGDPRIFTTVGVHPHDTGGTTPEALEKLFPNLTDPKVRAVGETGIDYFRDYAPYDVQRACFTRQVAWARETGLPLVVHSREKKDGPSAHADVLRILEEEGRGKVRGVLHCFSGDLEVARRAAGLGFRLGIGGGASYRPKKTGPLLAAIAEELGPEMFLLETDCPYQTPLPHRNERNEPAYIPEIARVLSGYLGLTVSEIERITDASAIELFGFDAGRA
jgi:TatD DNase family protein